nr:GcrA family cell cycle regulator [uncultured Brevundimonas sp.]
MTASAWTTDRVNRLKTLWHEGRTAEQIAAELQSGITRSAVLGKVYRMGLSVDRPKRPGVRKPPVEERGKAAPGPSPRTGEERTVSSSAFDLPSGGLSILTIGPSQCRWPYGDPRSGVSFCGRPVARGAFCAGHAEVGYRAPPGGAASLLALAELA